jgi:pimeloyl-ACP methyl ester carboxylesterase
MLHRILATLAGILALGAASGAAAAEPCTAATGACTEWVAAASANQRLLVHRTLALDAPNDKVVRALVVVHGLGRDAPNYFRTATAAAFLAGALESTLIVAPRFAANDGKRCKDALATGEINWICAGGNNWRSGGPAAGNDAVTSFDVADEIVRKLARNELFPNLKIIVIAGHSAGGQFVSRYAMANRIHERLPLPLAYVVANPSSYAYLDAVRPADAAGEFRPFAGSAACPGFNRWPYGLEERGGYTARLDDDQLRKQFAARTVTYLFGDLDTLPRASLDVSCPAMAQGANRLARGEAYAKYAAERLRAPHRSVVIPLCGHNARCMFTADAALPLLFPAH